MNVLKLKILITLVFPSENTNWKCIEELMQKAPMDLGSSQCSLTRINQFLFYSSIICCVIHLPQNLFLKNIVFVFLTLHHFIVPNSGILEWKLLMNKKKCFLLCKPSKSEIFWKITCYTFILNHHKAYFQRKPQRPKNEKCVLAKK